MSFKKTMRQIAVRFLRNKPYGGVWNTPTANLDWYKTLHDSRREQHDAFVGWFEVVNSIDTIKSVCEIGCGYGVFYPKFFEKLLYYGIDMSKEAIEHCRKEHWSPFAFVCGDVLTMQVLVHYNLVFSHSVIDHVSDMDECLRAHVRRSNRWIYVTSYRGYFPDINKHKYTYNSDHECYYNDVSPIQAFYTLKDAGCKEITIFPSYTGRADQPFETVIIARV